MEKNGRQLLLVVNRDDTPAAATPNVATVGSTPGTVVNMHSLSPTMAEGTKVKWYKEEGGGHLCR